MYAFENAFKEGFEDALWIDANGIVIRDLEQIFFQIRKYGYFFHSQYHTSVGEWSSDLTLSKLDIDRKEAFNIPEISAFCFGLSNKHPKGRKIFQELKSYCDDLVSFRGAPEIVAWQDTLDNKNACVSDDIRVHGHRHDQTVASILAYKEKCHIDISSVLNYADTNENVQHHYRNYIPPWIKILQNRDVKYNHYLYMIDKHNNYLHTNKKILHFFISILVGTLQVSKVYTRYLLFKLQQKKYHFLLKIRRVT